MERGEQKLEIKNEKGDNKEVVYKPLTYREKDVLVPIGRGEKRETLFLYFAALTVDLIQFACGCSAVWTSATIPVLKSPDPDINPLGTPLNPLQESWIASLPALGATIGPLLTGTFADRYGRKKSLIALCLLKITSFVVLAFATNINLYYITRLLLGIGIGMSYSVLPSYVGEICEDHNRGKFGCLLGLFLTLGTLYSIAIGPLLSIKVFTLSCAAPLVFVLVCFFVIPETPIYSAAAGKRKEARKALMKLRNKTKEAANKDLQEILDLIENSSKTSNGYLDLFRKGTLRKALFICVGLCCLQQLTGIHCIMAFIHTIFSLTKSEIPPNVSSILVAAVQVMGILIAAAAVERVGRKLLLLISSVVCAISLFSFGLYFYLQSIEFHYIQHLFWLPVTSLVVFTLSFNLGLGPVPWAIVGEIFPSSVKATASALTTAACALTAFAVLFIFPFTMQFFGAAINFFMFGGACVIGSILIYLGVPETKGKNIVEIQRMLRKTKT